MIPRYFVLIHRLFFQVRSAHEVQSFDHMDIFPTEIIIHHGKQLMTISLVMARVVKLQLSEEDNGSARCFTRRNKLYLLIDVWI